MENNMVAEDYVSFETAKLLKEKWFEGLCTTYYDCFTTDNFHCGNEPTDFNSIDTKIRNIVAAPTLQMVMKWLRKKYNQNITVKAHNNIARLKTIYYAEVQNLSEPAEKGFCVNGCTFKDTYEEACEAAIKYCLENLI